MDKQLAHELLYDMARRVPDKLISFGRALEEAGALVDGWPYFLERADKWSDEYALWVEHDYPQHGDAGWEAWSDALDKIAAA